MKRRCAVLLCAFLWPLAARAAEVHVMISAGFFHVYSQLGPAFEKETGNHLVTVRGPSLGDSPEAIPARLARGEAADVAIMELRDGAFEFVDNYKGKRTGKQCLFPIATVLNGKRIPARA